jgi:hypothetical protein
LRRHENASPTGQSNGAKIWESEMTLPHDPNDPNHPEFVRTEPASRYELIHNQSSVCLFDGEGCIDTYDTVPDRARTDPAIGSVEVREAVFLALVSIVESLNGGWLLNNKECVSYHFSNLIGQFGDTMNIDLVEQLFLETLKNEEVICDFEGIKEGGPDGRR